MKENGLKRQKTETFTGRTKRCQLTTIDKNANSLKFKTITN